jgi:hypothetical protein
MASLDSDSDGPADLPETRPHQELSDTKDGTTQHTDSLLEPNDDAFEYYYYMNTGTPPETLRPPVRARTADVEEVPSDRCTPQRAALRQMPEAKDESDESLMHNEITLHCAALYI